MSLETAPKADVIERRPPIYRNNQMMPVAILVAVVVLTMAWSAFLLSIAASLIVSLF
jgi:hypothetical protein